MIYICNTANGVKQWILWFLCKDILNSYYELWCYLHIYQATKFHILQNIHHAIYSTFSSVIICVITTDIKLASVVINMVVYQIACFTYFKVWKGCIGMGCFPEYLTILLSILYLDIKHSWERELTLITLWLQLVNAHSFYHHTENLKKTQKTFLPCDPRIPIHINKKFPSCSRNYE